MLPASILERASRAGVLALLLALTAGCGNEGPKLYPVTGQVFHGDKPAAGANVVFQLKEGPQQPGAPIPSAIVQEDGSFTIRTHPHGEGAPPGDYKVLITWYPPNSREVENPVNKLPQRYGSPETTPLTIVVKEGANELEPFRIPAK